jgi:carbonic anhydrase
MRDVSELVTGYRTFMKEQYHHDAEIYRSLADNGQSPRTMVVACCDSRVDPSRIFSAKPGQLFIVRNVANLVPPFEPHGDYHGTSAALEFAITSLGVENIVVLGHARCGGVRGFLQGQNQTTPAGTFIGKWISLLKPAWGEVVQTGGRLTEEQRQRALEQTSIRYSLENLRTFPFVKDRLEQGKLALHGGFFDIATGGLLSYDAEKQEFAPVA